MIDVTVRAVGLVTGWGRGVAALPGDAHAAAGSRRVIAATPTPRASDRLRRATRECLLGVDAVDALLEDGGLTREEVRGDRTALVYVTASAYGASNRAFAAGGGGALYFPYTAPSAVPAEVAIEFGLHGAYVVLIGGATATIDALGHATTLLARGACGRAIVLAVETFAECEDLHARGRWLLERPLVEGAAAVLLEPGPPSSIVEGFGGAACAAPIDPMGLGGAPRTPPTSSGGSVPCSPKTNDVRWAGETLACAPLVALALARASARSDVTLGGRWRGREATIRLAVSPRAHAAAS